MVKNQKSNKVLFFLEKHQKKVKIFNIIIWLVLLILMILYNGMKQDRLTQEQMIKEINERCSNELIIPVEGEYKVKFNYNQRLNITECEVLKQ